MTTIQKIESELAKLDEDGLKELHLLVRDFVRTRKRKKRGPGILESLAKIKIQGPPDFSRNLDQYLSGEKRVEDHLPGHAVRRRPRKRA